MEVAGGKTCHVFGTYREVDFPRRLVYTWDLEEAEDTEGPRGGWAGHLKALERLFT